VSNALKFTPEGGNIEINAFEEENIVTFEVKDDGIGISQEDISKLFRIDVHHTTIGVQKEEGTGLGLILCKEFVEKNNGRIWVESIEGQGSSFKLPSVHSIA
jgi:signal transduction histidine kinase